MIPCQKSSESVAEVASKEVETRKVIESVEDFVSVVADASLTRVMDWIF